MKLVIVHCHECQNPTEITVSLRDFWTEEMNQPFVCNDCLRKMVNRAVEKCNIAKAESATRAFITAQPKPKPSNPTQHEIHRNRQRQSPA